MYSGSNYPNGFKNGITIRGVPLSSTHPGEVYWFNSSSVVAKNGIAGSDGNDGSYHQPFGTLDGAVGKMKANRGDVLAIMPGSSVTISAAAAVAFDVAGIAIIGLGVGSLRPTLNFTTTDGTVTISAANITLVNLLFTGGIDAVVAPITFSAADCAMIGCETRDVTGQATKWLITTAAAHRLLIDGWVHRGAAAAGTTNALEIVGGDDIEIKNFSIDGNFSAACIQNLTTAAVNLKVGGGNGWNYARTRNAADVIFTALTTTTGFVGPNIAARLQDNAANITEAFVGANMQFMQPIEIVNLDGESSMQTNIVASTD